ncbi:alpha carbonic anhydrase 7-like [Carex rostrata]
MLKGNENENNFYLLVSLVFSIHLASSKKVEDEHEFSYKSGAENGPEHWGEINVNWTKCGTGHQQSPIDLLNERVQVNPYLGRLHRSYQPANAIMKNHGHDVELKWLEDAGIIQIDENNYHLIRLYWHTPSEHTINGRRFAMEMHMVHQTQDGKKIAVIGFLYKYGRPDPLVNELEPYIKENGNKTNEEESAGIVDPRKINPGSRKYYRYMGSLTIQKGLCEKFDAHDNARPIQCIYDRIINMYRPMKIDN